MANAVEILALAAKLPSGLNDPKALEKLAKEEVELEEMLAFPTDWTGAYLEAADVFYYVCKTMHSGMLPLNDALKRVRYTAERVGLPIPTIAEICKAKYTLRARPGNPKDDEAERMAALEVLAAIKRGANE